jgi:hypothetical protein
MKMYGEVEVYRHHSWPRHYIGSDWFSLRPDRFTPRERDHGTHWIRSWLTPRAGMEAVEKKYLVIEGIEHRTFSPTFSHYVTSQMPHSRTRSEAVSLQTYVVRNTRILFKPCLPFYVQRWSSWYDATDWAAECVWLLASTALENPVWWHVSHRRDASVQLKFKRYPARLQTEASGDRSCEVCEMNPGHMILILQCRLYHYWLI